MPKVITECRKNFPKCPEEIGWRLEYIWLELRSKEASNVEGNHFAILFRFVFLDNSNKLVDICNRRRTLKSEEEEGWKGDYTKRGLQFKSTRYHFKPTQPR